MYVLDVIVLSRAAPAGTLSYRSAKAHAPGTLLSLDLRKQQTLGVVTACDPAMERRAELRSATYTLRGSRDAVAGSLPQASMDAARDIAIWHATSLGSVLSVLLADVEASDGTLPELKQVGTFERNTIEGDIDARVAAYRELIANRGSGNVLFVVPTLEEAKYWKSVWKGVRGVTVLPPERSVREWIANPPAFTIIERAGSGSYTLPKRPYLDVRRVHELFAKRAGALLALGDFPLPLEFRAKPDAALNFSEATSISVLDARREKDDQSDAPWQVLPDEVVVQIRESLANCGRVALLGVRTGYAPAVVCRDCGQSVADERGRALTFSQEGGERVFRSADGVTHRPADVACSRCGSWNLLPLGIGVERIHEEAQKLFNEVPLAYLPPDVLKSPRKTREALKSVADGGILVGTEAMLPYLLSAYGTRSLSLSVIVSADSLLAFPLWRARERFVRLALFMAALAKSCTIITRRPDDTALSVLRDIRDTAFFAEESMLRKALRYPPFATLISIGRQGGEAALAKLEPVISRAVDGTDTLTPPESKIAGGMRSRTTIVTAPEGSWPDPALASRLASLPPSVRVRVDPEALW